MDDELLRALGRAQRHQDPMPTPVPTDPNAETPGAADALTRPLDEAERASVLDAVFGQLDAEAPAEAGVEGAPSVAAEAAPVVAIAPSSSRGRVMGAIAVLVAMAAALVLWFGRPTAVVAELPSYALTELRGGIAEMRSEPNAVDRVVDLPLRGKIELVVTPAVASAEPLVVDLVAQGEGRPDRMARVKAETSTSGAVRLSGVLTEMIDLEPGAWTITVVVSPAAAAPGDVEAALTGVAGRRVVFRVALRGE